MPSTHSRYSFGPFVLDPAAGQLTRDGAPVPLAPKTYELLVALAGEPGRLFSKDELFARVWPDTIVSEGSLNRAVATLRQALGDSADEPQYIQTVARRGYRFVAPVTVIKDASAPPPAAEPLPQNWRPMMIVAAVGAVVLVAMSAVFVGRTSNHPSPIRSIAVLPLENLSANPEDEYFADGVTEALITELAKLENVKVISRTSIMQYKRPNKRLPEIARELDVDAVVEGTVLQANRRYRVTAQLIEAETDTHRWAESYERSERDVITVQNDIARAIAREIRAQLSPAESERFARRALTNDPEAYRLYLRGRHFWALRTKESLQKAIASFEAAIARDPQFAAAYAALADTYNVMHNIAETPTTVTFPRARAAALRALQIDPLLGEAHSALAYVEHYGDRDFAEAERQYRRAIELNPSHATAYHTYAGLLAALGRFDEAIRLAEQAVSVDPLSPATNAGLTWDLMMARQYDRAVQQGRRTVELFPEHISADTYLGRAASLAGRHQEAIGSLEAAAKEYDNAIILSWLAHAYALADRRADAERLVRDLEQRARQRYVNPYYRAFPYAALGRHDEAITLLEQARAEGADQLVWLKVEPAFDPLRPDPRFRALVRSAGFPL